MDNLFERTSIKKAYFTLALPVVLSMAVTLIYIWLIPSLFLRLVILTWLPEYPKVRRFSP